MFGTHKIAIPILLAAASLLGACSDPKQVAPKQAPEVGYITVAPRDVPQVSTFVGQTESSRQVEIVPSRGWA